MAGNILFSYRRCPYAMRARMALIVAHIQCKVYEIDFKNKPETLLEISPKGTVPVLRTEAGEVLEESLDIMHWALQQNDPEEWLRVFNSDLITENDGAFKAALDRYKYPNRFPGEDCSNARAQGGMFMEVLNKNLQEHRYLSGDKTSLTDIAIFPFIRQFRNIDNTWFDALPYPPLHAWLRHCLESDLFQKTIKKQRDNPCWLV